MRTTKKPMTLSTILSIASLLGVGSLLAGFYKLIGNKIKQTSVNHQALELGLQAMLRDRIYDIYRECKRKGYAELEDRENFENLYTQYHNLGANGVMNSYREKFLDLPTE